MLLLSVIESPVEVIKRLTSKTENVVFLVEHIVWVSVC